MLFSFTVLTGPHCTSTPYVVDCLVSRLMLPHCQGEVLLSTIKNTSSQTFQFYKHERYTEEKQAIILASSKEESQSRYEKQICLQST